MVLFTQWLCPGHRVEPSFPQQSFKYLSTILTCLAYPFFSRVSTFCSLIYCLQDIISLKCSVQNVSLLPKMLQLFVCPEIGVTHLCPLLGICELLRMESFGTKTRATSSQKDKQTLGGCGFLLLLTHFYHKSGKMPENYLKRRSWCQHRVPPSTEHLRNSFFVCLRDNNRHLSWWSLVMRRRLETTEDCSEDGI